MTKEDLSESYKDVIPYGIFGVLTTLVNIAVYWFVAHILGIRTVPSSIIAWVAAVSFAYLTNRKWVFHSEANTARAIIRETLYFFLCRLITGVFDWLFMYITVDLLHWQDVWMKLISNVMVIILNYLASRFVVFKKRGLN